MSKIIGGKASIQTEENQVVVFCFKRNGSGGFATHRRTFDNDREGCRAALHFCRSHNLEVLAA